FMDITQRKYRERGLSLLAEVQNDFSTPGSPADIMNTVCERIAKHLGLTHCLMVEIDQAAGECTVLNNYYAPTELNLVGTYRIDDFHSEAEQRLLASGRPLVINDVHQDLRTAERIEHFMALGIGALVNASYVTNGQWKFVLSAMRREPYQWPQEYIELLGELCACIYERMERILAEAALRESEERWKFALQVSNLGAWELNLVNHTAWRSLRHDQIFGYRELLPEWTYEIFLQHVLEEDRAEVDRCFRQSMKELRDWVVECRIRRADGAVRWIWAHGKHLDEAGKPLLHVFGLVGDITERKQAELALKDADRRKDEFLAMLAHELRNPLGPIRNVAQLLKMEDLDPARLSWCSDVVDRQVGHLSQLVDGLLDISRITLGKIELKKEPVMMADFVLPAVETIRPLMEANRQEFNLTLPSQPIWVEGDRVRLTQVVINLLSNAAKYTQNGGRIRLTVEQDNDEICIRVCDSGCGIEPSVLPKLFDLFYQVDCDIARSQGGLGIGLSLVHRLVAMHGGEVRAFSAGLGQGSEFVVRLPLLSVSGFTPAVIAKPPVSSVNEKLGILVVDDYFAAAESLAMLLENQGYQVWIAHDGQSAIEIAKVKQPQVVILDIGLPVMDGYEVAEKLRQCAELDEVFIIALSGYAQPNNPDMLSTTSFDEYLVKPLDMEKLQKLLNKYRMHTVN
ncbi:MAG: ATP-binding protein, partial [Methylobacter sp.]